MPSPETGARPLWLRADGVAIGLLLGIFAATVWYAFEGVKPWETNWGQRTAAGKLPGLNDVTRSAWWVAAVANAVVSAVLLALSFWWAKPRAASRLRFRPEGAGKSGKAFWWVLLAIVTAGVAAGASRLPMTLWGDEEWAFRDMVHGKWLPVDGKNGDLQGPLEFQPHPWKRTLFYNHGGNNHLLFSALNRAGQEAWRAASGKPRDHYSERWAKAFPALPFGVATLVLIACFFRWLGSPATGLAAAALYALHPLALRFASEARGYSMVTAFTIAAVWFAMRACERCRWRDWSLFALFEFLSLATWSAALYPMLALNAAVLVVLFTRRGGLRGSALGRWLVTGAVAAMAFFPLYGPHVPQVQRATKTGGMGGAPMNSIWLHDTVSKLGTGMLYHESQPGNPAQVAFTERRKDAPRAVGALALALASTFGIGCIALARKHGRAALLVLAPVLALPLAYLVHEFVIGVELRYWYKIYAYPFAFGTAAAGVFALAGELPRALRPPARIALPALFVAAFAWLVSPALAAVLEYPHEALRRSAALTRGQHEALPPGGTGSPSEVVTVRLWRPAPLYDPRARDARSRETLESIIAECRAMDRELYVTAGLYRYVETVTPGIYELLEDPTVFEKLATLPSDDPLFTLHVFHLVPKP